MIVWLLATPAAAEEWTLRDAVAEALARNLELRSESLNTASAGASLVEARAEWGPTLSATASATGVAAAATPGASDEALAWSVGVSQPLPTGGTVWVGGSQDEAFARRVGPDSSVSSFTGLSIEQPLLDGAWGAASYARNAARLDLRAAELAEHDARERLVVDVANAYWELVAARERTRLAVRSVEIAEAQLADTRERFDEGFAGAGDVLQLEVAQGSARQSRVVAEATEAAAERTLARRMGIPLASAPHISPLDRPAPPPEDPDPDVALALAQRGNVTWLLAQLSVESARRDLAATRNGALPDLTLSASAGLTADSAPDDAIQALSGSADTSWGLGATLSVPLAWAGTRASLEGGRLALSQAELQAEATWEDVQGQVAGALDAVRRDRARVELAEATLKAAQAGLAADQDLYREGRGLSRDVVRSLEKLEDAQVAGLDAQIDLQSSLLTLARLEGRVIEGMGL